MIEDYPSLLTPICEACNEACAWENTGHAEIANLAIHEAIADWPVGRADNPDVQHLVAGRKRNSHFERERITKRIQKHVKAHPDAVPVQFIDPISGFIIFELLSFIVGKVLSFLWDRWFAEPKFAVSVQACAFAAPDL